MFVYQGRIECILDGHYNDIFLVSNNVGTVVQWRLRCSNHKATTVNPQHDGCSRPSQSFMARSPDIHRQLTAVRVCLYLLCVRLAPYAIFILARCWRKSNWGVSERRAVVLCRIAAGPESVRFDGPRPPCSKLLRRCESKRSNRRLGIGHTKELTDGCRYPLGYSQHCRLKLGRKLTGIVSGVLANNGALTSSNDELRFGPKTMSESLVLSVTASESLDRVLLRQADASASQQKREYGNLHDGTTIDRRMQAAGQRSRVMEKKELRKSSFL